MTVKRQEMLPAEIREKLPPLYSQENNKDPIVYLKLFAPFNQWTWFITEGEQQGDDFIFFGYVIGHEKEWGYTSMNELLAVKGPADLYIERDEYFTPKPASQVPEIETHESQAVSIDWAAIERL
jgi:hypothetical protein